jgi:hypothetical protein
MDILQKIKEHHDTDTSPRVAFIPSLMKTKSVDIETNAEFSGVATRQVVDLEGEMVLSDGLDWEYALNAKAMYLNHDYTQDPVAKLLSVKKVTDGWYFRGVFMKSCEHARKTHAIASELGQFGVSIGFLPIDSGRPTQDERTKYGPCDIITRKAKVLELSVAWMPASDKTWANMSEAARTEIEKQKKYLFLDDTLDHSFVNNVIPTQKKIIVL